MMMRRIAFALAALAVSAATARAGLDVPPAPSSSAPLVVMFDELSGLAPPVGTLAFVRDCRALTLSAGVLSLQVAGNGSGCTASFNGSAWQIDGTAIPVMK